MKYRICCLILKTTRNIMPFYHICVCICFIVETFVFVALLNFVISDGGFRGQKLVNLKTIAEAAVENCTKKYV